MRILSRLTLIALAALVLGGCQKQVDYTGAPDIQPVLPEPVTATLQGSVFDESGNPASGATVNVGSQTVTTDSRGYFRITGAALDKNQSLVTATKAGYFKAYRTFAATSAANQVVIKLIPRVVAGTVDATAGGTAALSNGSKVTLPAGGVVDAATGGAYTGTVSVYAAYIDPTGQDIAQTIPGSLMANDKDGRRVLLNSYGMLAVELEGSNGQKLQIKSGQNAVLTTAIPTAAQATAPATIPMWYVDEATGIWKEEGSATKVGNTYVGNVPHFSYWNCDIPMTRTVTLSVTVLGSNGQPLPSVLVRITRPTPGAWNGAAYGWTDSLGHVNGLVPGDEPLVLNILGRCADPLYTQNVGPFSSNTSLTVTASIPAVSLTQVSGTLVNCSNAPVTNGYALVIFDNLVHYVGTNNSGQFSTSLINCSGSNSNVQILGIDNSTNTQSTVASVPFAPTSTNAGTITVCTQTSINEYITYTIDGGQQVSLNPSDSLGFYASQIQGTTNWNVYISGLRNLSSGAQEYISLGFTSAAAPGTYNVPNFQTGNLVTASSNVTTTITVWPTALGDYIQGTFTGTFIAGGTQTPRTASGSYRLRRMF